MKLYLPQDTSAQALGADAIAAEIQRLKPDAELIRNGSRGLCWLEPLLEVETRQGRIGFGPLNDTELASVLSAIDNDPSAHPRYLGPVEQLPYLKQQQRVSFARAGLGDPLCLDNYQRLGGLTGLRNALTLFQSQSKPSSQAPQQIVDAIKTSGLRGRGGAAFPAGIKWQTVLDSQPEPGRCKYIVCNADEGDSGTFADRLLMEADPYQLLEGMVIAALAVGAERGYIYLRSEYPNAERILTRAIANAEAAGWLGDNLLGSGKRFELQLRLGAEAYICGEETALLDSLEGKRGMVRAKPPLPAIEGLFGQPTLVHNVLTLAAVTSILADGADSYQDYGVGRSRGTLAFQLGGNVKRGGLIELPFGTTLRQLIEQFGGGSRSGRPIRAIQVGGPLGAYLPEADWDTPLDYEAFTTIGAMLGHGGIVVFDDSVDMAAQARYAMEFCAIESCGKCTPCRIGSTRGVEVIDRLIASDGKQKNDQQQLISDLCDTMEHASLCAMGGLTPLPVRSAMKHWPQDFGLTQEYDPDAGPNSHRAGEGESC